MEAKATQIKIINQARYSYYDIIRFNKRIDVYERISSVVAPFYWIVSFASGYIKVEIGWK